MEQLASLWPELVATTVGVLLGGIGALASPAGSSVGSRPRNGSGTAST